MQTFLAIWLTWKALQQSMLHPVSEWCSVERTCDAERKVQRCFILRLLFYPESRSTSHKDLMQMDETDEKYLKVSLHRQIKDDFYLTNSEHNCFRSAISAFLCNKVLIFLLIILPQDIALNNLFLPPSYPTIQPSEKKIQCIFSAEVCSAILPHLLKDLKWSCEIRHGECRAWGTL